MTIKEVNKVLADKSMQNKETNFKVKNNGVVPKPPKYFTDFANKVLIFIEKQQKFNAKQEQFNQFVIDQFKAHGWVK